MYLPSYPPTSFLPHLNRVRLGSLSVVVVLSVVTAQSHLLLSAPAAFKVTTFLRFSLALFCCFFRVALLL